MFDPCKGALPAIRKGLQSPLAVAASTRLSGLPDVPTFSEIGVGELRAADLDRYSCACGDA